MMPILASALLLTAGRADWTGIVHDARGKPLPGVTVLIYTAGPKVGTSPFCPSCYLDCGKRALTDAKGRFRVPSLDASLRFRVVLFRDGYRARFVAGVDPLRPSGSLRLEPRASNAAEVSKAVAGKVVDDAGRPVPYALVSAEAVQYGDVTSFGGTLGEGVSVADAQGRFRFFGVTRGQRVLFSVSGRGYAPRKAWAPLGEKKAEFRLDEGSSLAGVVRGPDGRPLANVGVVALPNEHNSETFLGPYEIGTDEQGRFFIPNVAGGQRFTVCAKMDGLAPRGLAAARVELEVPRKGPAPVAAEFLASPGATLKGRIVLADGRPIPAHTRVMLGRKDAQDMDTWDTQFTEAAADGTFAFRGLPRGERIGLNVYIEGYEEERPKGRPAYDPLRNTVVVPEEGDAPSVTIRLVATKPGR